MVEKVFEGKLLIKIIPSTLLLIFCKTDFNSKDMVKSITDPDNNFLGNS